MAQMLRVRHEVQPWRHISQQSTAGATSAEAAAVADGCGGGVAFASDSSLESVAS